MSQEVAKTEENCTPGSGLDPEQLIAIEHLACGHSVTDAAKAVNRDRKTIQRWMKQEQFKTCLRDRQNEVIGEVRTEVAGLLPLALDTFRRAMTGQDVTTAAYKAAADLLRSARIIGDHVVEKIPDNVLVKFADPSPNADPESAGNPVTAPSNPQ